MTDVIMNKELGSDPALRRYNDVREPIANPVQPTPLLRLNRAVPDGRFPLFLKLEWFNPFGSIKDRTAMHLLKGMEGRGELDRKKIVEPTSGNTGLALAVGRRNLIHKAQKVHSLSSRRTLAKHFARSHVETCE